MPDAARHVGLLFVHGIGEQKRFDHVRAEATWLAELIRCTHADAQVSTVDRTATWPHPAGEPGLEHDAPVTLSVVVAGARTDYHCHEVWWADLGKRSSLGESVAFWTWGLGQWSAPFYRRLDLSRCGESHDPSDRPLTILPDSVAGAFWTEVKVRAQLWLAALAAVLSVATLSLLKTVVRRVFGGLPGPTLIVQYLGDVQIYEERARPNRTTLSDPGHPLRVRIRRRMVTELVAMGARGYDEWHVLAHSLGTVVAFNGLTELGHTLPNYLPERLWEDLPPSLTDPAGVRRRVEPEIPLMMPGRPGWLAPDAVVNRRTLFDRLRLVLTYGSPLDKFAAIWPRIIAAADDMTDERSAFHPDARWLNIAAPHDPVAGVLHAFGAKAGGEQGRKLERLLPPQRNWRAANGPDLGVSHIRYLNSWDALLGRSERMAQRERLVRRLFGLPGDASIDDDLRARGGPPAWMLYILVFAALIGATALVTWAGLKGALAVTDHAPADRWADLLPAGRFALGVAVAITGLAGLIRWRREAGRNVRMTTGDALLHPFARGIRADAAMLLLVAVLLLPVALVHDALATLRGWGVQSLYNYSALLIAPVLIALAILLQAYANKRGARPPR